MMELWDGVKRFDENNMSNYTNVRTSMLNWLRGWYMLFIYWFYFCLHQSIVVWVKNMSLCMN